MKKIIPAALGAATIAGGWLLVAALYSPVKAEASTRTTGRQPVVHEAYNPELIDRDIAFHEGRVARDPQGAIGYRMLSAAYLARSRESDADEFAWKADDAARRSLALRTRLNEAAEVLLVQSLLEQHRFRDALKEVRRGIALFPEERGLVKLEADVLIELGEYTAAEAVLRRLSVIPEDVARTAIEARLESVKGRHDRAIKLLESAYTVVESKREVSNATLGWFRTRIATEYESLGDHNRTIAEFKKAVALSPRSYKATLGLTRAAVSRQDWKDCLAWAERTLTIANSLDAIAARGDAHHATGKTAEATRDYAAVRRMYLDEVARFTELGKGGPLKVRPIDRQFASFAAARAMFAADALPAAERDFANRPDAVAKANLAALRKLAATSPAS